MLANAYVFIRTRLCIGRRARQERMAATRVDWRRTSGPARRSAKPFGITELERRSERRRWICDVGDGPLQAALHGIERAERFECERPPTGARAASFDGNEFQMAPAIG